MARRRRKERATTSNTSTAAETKGTATDGVSAAGVNAQRAVLLDEGPVDDEVEGVGAVSASQ